LRFLGAIKGDENKALGRSSIEAGYFIRAYDELAAGSRNCCWSFVEHAGLITLRVGYAPNGNDNICRRLGLCMEPIDGCSSNRCRRAALVPGRQVDSWCFPLRFAERFTTCAARGVRICRHAGATAPACNAGLFAEILPADGTNRCQHRKRRFRYVSVFLGSSRAKPQPAQTYLGYPDQSTMMREVFINSCLRKPCSLVAAFIRNYFAAFSR
jgi:hypothetical protein